jgi:RND family efflux transporter MFP subunit
MWRRIGCIALIVIVLAVVALIAYKQTTGGGWKSFSAGKSKKDEQPKESNFEAARRGDLKITVEATGETEPVTDIEVKSEATGKIIAFAVKEGDHVKKGDVICTLDQSNTQLIVQQSEIALSRAKLGYEQAKSSQSSNQRSQLASALASAQASVDSAQQSYDTAQSTYSRIEIMHTKGYATDQELENARQQVAAAKAQLDSAKSNLENTKLQLKNFDESSNAASIKEAKLALDSAQVNLAESRKQLGDSVIKAPIDGIIMEKLLDVGDSVVSINSAYGGGNTIVTIADLSRIQIRTSVDEIDIGKIKLGQNATVTVDAFPQQDFAGKVTNIFPQGVTSGQGLVSFIALVEVENPEGKLLGKMTADVKIEAQVIKNVLLVPLAATRAGKEPDTTVVEVLKPDQDEFAKKVQTEERTVKTGDTDYVDIVILDGLKEGEKVKVRGFENQIRFE